jgi:hypothetical protein
MRDSRGWAIRAVPVLALLAVAAGGGDGAKEETNAAIVAFALVPAIVLLLALPLALYVASTAPVLVTRSTEVRARRPLWSFLLGLADTVAVVALASAVGAHPLGGIAVLLLGAAVLACAVIGLVGSARGLGERLLAQGARPASPLRQLVWGWLLLAGLPLLPVLGVLVLLYLGLGAVGAGHLSFHLRRRRPLPPPPAMHPGHEA